MRIHVGDVIVSVVVLLVAGCSDDGGGTARATRFNGNAESASRRVCIDGTASCGTMLSDGSFTFTANASGSVTLAFEAEAFTGRLRVAGVPDGGTVTLEDVSCDAGTGTCSAADVRVEAPASGEACASVTCAAGEECCNASCGTCVPAGSACHQVACAPGTTSCGGTFCGPGEFCCNESCGICAPEGGACTQQFCGGPPPADECSSDGDCAAIELCRECDGGTCAVVRCSEGRCGLECAP